MEIFHLESGLRQFTSLKNKFIWLFSIKASGNACFFVFILLYFTQVKYLISGIYCYKISIWQVQNNITV